MPSSNKYLRDKFMRDGNDGIATAEDLLDANDIRVLRGIIYLDYDADVSKDVGDAIDFLVYEWDYTTAPLRAKADDSAKDAKP